MKGAIPVEIPDCTEETAVHNVAPETQRGSCKDTVEELLLKDKDDISRLMKMERRSENGNGLKDDDKKGERWFPYLDKCKAGDVYLSSGEVLEAMEPYIMDVRKEKFRNAVNNRSYSVCLVVEGLSDFGNVSAAFRSADALGIQSVHVVSCDSSRRCLSALKQNAFGYWSYGVVSPSIVLYGNDLDFVKLTDQEHVKFHKVRGLISYGKNIS